MSDGAADPRTFYTQRLPAQFNGALAEQEQAAERARRTLDDMRAVDATLCVRVEGEDGGLFFLNVAGGRMSAGDEAAHPPFLTLVQDRRSFERLAEEAGDSALGMLGGLAGLAGDIKLTRSRIANLSGVSGTLLFEVTGEDGFTLRTHFGEGGPREEPDAAIRVDPAVYADLRAGKVDPQQAFMGGQLEVTGDMQLAMALALAVLSPD